MDLGETSRKCVKDAADRLEEVQLLKLKINELEKIIRKKREDIQQNPSHDERVELELLMKEHAELYKHLC